MSVAAYNPVSIAAYRNVGGLSARERLIAWGLVGGLHAAALAGLILIRTNDKPQPEAPSIMVSVIAEQSAAPAPTPPAPPPPSAPETKPSVLATPRPTPSPMSAPAPKDPVPPAPVQAAAAPPSPVPAPSAPAPASVAMTPPNYTAAYLNNPGPAYPYESRRKREEGTVVLKVKVGVDGKPEQVQVDRSSGFAKLDQAALDIVQKRWRFVPAKKGDQAVSAWVAVPLQFELKDR